MTGARQPVIRTPDQRIRVFVSSTLRELADERRAVARRHRTDAARARDVRTRRPTPPTPRPLPLLPPAERHLRRHLLGQLRLGRARRRDSGLEDENDLAPRDDAQAHLHQGLRTTATNDSKTSSTASNRRHRRLPPLPHRRRTRRRVAGDLATLLADDSTSARRRRRRTRARGGRPRRVPAPYTTTIGREDDIGRSTSCSPEAPTGW